MSKCINDGKTYKFGETQAQFKLYNSANAAVFFFENYEDQNEIEAKFTLELRNLALTDEPEGVNEFKINLGPGEHESKILKSIDKNQGTALGMSYSYLEI